MKYKDKDEAIVGLREAVEKRLGGIVITSGDYILLERDIKRVTDKGVSRSTLMRIWGYVAGSTCPYTSTLNVLARYAGWKDFAAFCEIGAEGGSDDVLAPRISVLTDLAPRDHVLLRWSGDHEILVRYLGDGQFVIERSENSKLSVGDTFNCHLIIEGHPAYLDNLVHQNEPIRCYACGSNHGVHFEIRPIAPCDNEK